MPEFLYGERRYPIYGGVPERGDTAPDFSLVGTDLKDVSLSQWRGRRKILTVVTSVEWPSSTTVVERLLELTRDDADTGIIVVTMDSPFSVKRFVDSFDAPALAGLSGLRSAGFDKNYGVGIREGLLQGFYSRAIVVLDENDNVIYAANLADDEVEPKYPEIARALGLDQ